MKRLLAFVVLALSTLFGVDASAEPRAERAVFALVVTSNKSQKLARPDLHYADDDGARYQALFSNLTPHADVTLLTTFDRDSAKLYPDLVSKVIAPNVSNVRSAFTSIAKRVADATASGARADFYFVFAGHGDVEEGRGFLELEDGRLVSDDLTSLVASVGSTRTHVILDSCNSFFVINARKPGGRRFATGAEAGEKLNRALPNVGVFLSTSAEAETFEWSELGAGIFSHAVRSGLSGAADANHDGDISYDELAAFVATATKDVKNPRFRPNVFARGPSGKSSEPIVNLANASAKLAIPKGAGRVTLRDADDQPWIDANFSATTAEPTLYVPRRMAKGATLAFGGERHPLEVGENGVSLGTAKTAELIAGRGAGDIFKSLFAEPFGEEEVNRYREERAKEPPPVYGVSGDDVVRMGELLRQASENARSDRHLQALAIAGIGGFYSAIGLRSTIAGERPVGGEAVLTTLGGISLALGAWRALTPSREERAYSWFNQARLRSSPDFMASAEAQLMALAKRDREERLFWRYFGIVYGGLTVASMSMFAGIEAQQHHPGNAFFYGTLGFASAVGYAIPIIGTFSPTKTERLAELWERDPSRARLEAAAPSPVTLKPILSAGFVGLGGTF